MNKSLSCHEMFEQMKHCIPAGVNSPVRSFRAVGGTPVVFQSGQGSTLLDIEGRSYIDYVGSWGCMILGHGDPSVVKAVQSTCSRGLGFGACHAYELTLAQTVCEKVPGIEQVRFVNSGTEAAMSVLRLARAVTQRSKIVKLAGCYHGHVDALLVDMGSGGLTLGIPSSAGIPACVINDTLIADYNDLKSVERCFEQYAQDIAAIIVEPVAANMGCIPADMLFLKGLQELCKQHGSLLIFDEVVTGFRMAEGGAQSVYGVIPDITMLGKVIGGGMPVAAFGASQDIMSHLAPLGSVYQAGTLSGNPLAMAAGIATLESLSRPGFYQRLQNTTEQLAQGIKQIAEQEGVPCCIQFVCGMLSLFLIDKAQVRCYHDVLLCDKMRFKRFFHALLQQGIYWPPSPFESVFVSHAHTDEDVKNTLKAVRIALQSAYEQ